MTKRWFLLGAAAAAAVIALATLQQISYCVPVIAGFLAACIAAITVDIKARGGSGNRLLQAIDGYAVASLAAFIGYAIYFHLRH